MIKLHNNKFYIFLLTILLIFSISPCAYAADSSVQYENQADKFVFLPGSFWSDTDLFDNFKNVMPGDTVTQEITIKNKSKVDVNIFLRAVAHDSTNAPVSGADAVSMQDFLSKLSMTVHQGSKELFSASPDELGGFAQKVLLGKFAPGESTKLTVSLHIPIELGNEYANRVGEVDWVFTVEEVSSGSNIPGGTNKPSDEGDNPADSNVPESLNGADHFAYIVGYPDGTVRPTRDITRAEVATIFYRLLVPEVQAQYETQTNSFSDVKKRDWYNQAISTMAAMGIVGGYPDGSFQPNAPITRAEFAAIAVRFDQIEATDDTPFTDIANHWAWQDIARAASEGWVAGYEDGTFRPDNSITRAETMAIINRVLCRQPETVDDLLDGMIKWPDNADTAEWYYLVVQEATNGHKYEWKDNGFERWTEMNNEEEKQSFLNRLSNLFTGKE